MLYEQFKCSIIEAGSGGGGGLRGLHLLSLTTLTENDHANTHTQSRSTMSEERLSDL